MDFWQRYRAIDSRDARFDGQFVTAVSSTGIYCRPSCPARTPKPANVTFYRTSAAAHEAGFRACKRCLPEAVPGTPEWNLRNDTAGRAMRLIADGEVDRSGVGGLALRLGYSTRQLNRILREELGAGPLALARAARAQTARTLLTGTNLLLSDVAFAAGFSSIRQFNDTVSEVYALTPSQLRGASRHRPIPADGGYTALALTLPVRLPYDNGILAFLQARAVSGVEEATSTSYARMVTLPGGHGWFRAEAVPPRAGSAGVKVSILLEKLADLPVLLARIRRLFDLDADPTAIDAVLIQQPELAPLVRNVPGIRLPGGVDPHEILMRAMIGQQVSVKAATSALSVLAAAGSQPRLAVDGFTRLFPAAADIAASAADLLRGPARRIEAIRATAEALADGSLSIGVGDDVQSLRAKLLPLPGIGPWTADYVAMRVLGATDIPLGNDAAVRNAWVSLTRQGAPPGPRSRTDRSMAATLAQASPWRSYATMHLWRHTSAQARTVPHSSLPKEAVT
ncbi:AlkA N-terminal domain-containing protein [Arthrobacter sp. Br18]|uniref:DNA-3-methyladenine glycosylase 2 family protein n=1 Tax=Arthrobacter sp. Br18 TaxID=1312954 RepID=UPI00047CFE00|nr:AlkA N-terminal domain-containing protein [Arthrobacter sp. Br18]